MIVMKKCITRQWELESFDSIYSDQLDKCKRGQSHEKECVGLDYPRQDASIGRKVIETMWQRFSMLALVSQMA